jgi:hypothetical protein
MTNEPENARSDKPQITPVLVFKWSLPVLVSLLVLAGTFFVGWEPWFGYAAVIAGALGSLMYVGRSLGIGEG